MPDATKNGSLDINATSVFHKSATGGLVGGMYSSPDAPSILCKYTTYSGGWMQKSFPAGKSFLKIGASSSDCDLALTGRSGVSKIHVALRLIFNTWHVLEYAAEPSMLINGIKAPHAALEIGSACVVTVGDTYVALLAKSKTSDKPPLDPAHPVVTFKTKDHEFKFGLAGSVLVGSDSMCVVQGQDLETVVGVVFHHAGRPHFYSLKPQVTVDAVDANSAPRELKNGSIVTIGRTVYGVSINPPLEIDDNAYLPPTPFNGNLALLEITGNRIGSKLILPPAGRSIMVGRDTTNHFILDSLSVSKKHAQLIIYDNSVLVLDAHSTNGTFLEEEPIVKKLIHPGEIIRFADRRFLLCHSE